jgi:hypothetical protein
MTDVTSRRGLIFVGMLCAVALSQGATAEEATVLAKSKDWELLKVEDPFAEKSVQCQIRTLTVLKGGRRDRPLIIFDLTSARIVVRPDMVLQGSVQANRKLQGDTGDMGGRHEVVIRHGIRVDGNKLHSITVRDTGSGTMEARFDREVYSSLADEVRTGTKIFYLWAIDSARKAFDFPLDGLRELFPTARSQCAR